MESNAFERITEKLEETLSSQEFKRAEDFTEENGRAALFTSEAVAYSVLYNEKSKRFELRSAPFSDGEAGDWKTVSVWLFDPETDSAADADSIANDFSDTVSAKKRTEMVQQVRKKKQKGEDSTSDPVFFYNRLVGIFPELRDEISREKIEYGQVRPFSFAKEKVLPKISGLVSAYPDSDVCKKLCSLMGDMYQNGDLDTRSVVTIVLLNGLDDSAFAGIENQLSDELKTAAAAARKLRGKKIKPEKKKKPRKFTAATLNDMRK